MFQSYFQLQKRPFASIPAPELYFASASMEAARASLVRLIERHEGPGLVIGQVGIGKSLLCQLLSDSFRHLCRVVVLPSGRLCTRRSLLQVILYELGLPYRDLDEGELRLTLIDHVTNDDVCPNGILLLVDEAESLTLALLDELRAFTNLTTDGQPSVRLALFGTSRLEEKFTHPRLESFNQRLAGRFYLEPFRSDETRQYVEQQIRDCGGKPESVFTLDAYAAIHRATGGIPRLVNQLSDHAMILATADNQRRVTATCVEEAWADLQQLPTPLSHRGHQQAGHHLPHETVEFGELDELPRDIVEDTEYHLETIEAQLADADDSDEFEYDLVEDGEPRESPSTYREHAAPEVTLYFHPAHDPFGDEYEEEELVIDQFTAARTTTPLTPLRRVIPIDGDQKLAAIRPTAFKVEPQPIAILEYPTSHPTESSWPTSPAEITPPAPQATTAATSTAATSSSFVMDTKDQGPELPADFSDTYNTASDGQSAASWPVVFCYDGMEDATMTPVPEPLGAPSSRFEFDSVPTPATPELASPEPAMLSGEDLPAIEPLAVDAGDIVVSVMEASADLGTTRPQSHDYRRLFSQLRQGRA